MQRPKKGQLLLKCWWLSIEIHCKGRTIICSVPAVPYQACFLPAPAPPVRALYLQGPGHPQGMLPGVNAAEYNHPVTLCSVRVGHRQREEGSCLALASVWGWSGSLSGMLPPLVRAVSAAPLAGRGHSRERSIIQPPSPQGLDLPNQM